VDDRGCGGLRREIRVRVRKGKKSGVGCCKSEVGEDGWIPEKGWLNAQRVKGIYSSHLGPYIYSSQSGSTSLLAHV